MFKTKKDVDRHVRTALSKLHSENEKNLRGFTIAKLYYNIQEYATAQHYVSSYLIVNEEYAPAHKLLGQCLQQLKKPDKALESFQRSLNLDLKQPDLLVEVCKMLLSDENSTCLNKAKYWCDLAESEKVQHNAVFSLRLKLLNKNSLETTQIEELILKEITSRPGDPNLRVRIVTHFIEQNKAQEAFKYAYDLEMNNHSLFVNCIDWYSIVWLALSKYRQLPSNKKSWDYWLLSLICIERQVDLSFTNSNGGTTDIANLLFTFDQHLYEAAKCVLELAPQKEFGAQMLYHFRGQLCLHAVALIYRREQVLNKNQWREATKNSLPMLLFAFHCGTPDSKESWLKHSGEKIRQLVQAWNREGAFRCAQAGRTILSCIDKSSSDSLSSQVHNVISDQNVWATEEDMLSQVRQYCSDVSWRTKLFRLLFPNSDQLVKIQSSYLVSCEQLAEPLYELPKRSEIELYEEIAQYLRPQSLQHMIYLCTAMDNLCDVRCKYFNGLNFSTQNLAFCGAESLTRLDIETFLCAAVIQTQRSFEVERVQYENYNAKNVGKPRILPFANMSTNLCSESQSNWWQAAYQVYKNLAGDNLAELRATLQYGIEAVRGVNGPKIDLIIILKLGKIFATRAQDSTKAVERGLLEARAVTLYKYGLTMLKLHNKGVLEPFRKLFKYSGANSTAVEREINYLAEEAVTMIATRYFKTGDYEDCIEELAGIQLPYATYFQAEAYRKLDESNKTPKKTKKFYSDKARDCLDQTLQLLSYSNDKNHPLKNIVHTDMRRTQLSDIFADDDPLNDIDNREEFLNESFNASRIHRESSMTVAKTAELENIIKQMMNTLTFVKEELVDRIRPEISDIRNDMALLKDKVSSMEEGMKKRSEPPSRDEAAKVLDDLYIIGDDLQQVMLSQYSQPQQQGTPQQRMQTPNAMLNQATAGMLHNPAAGANIYNSPLYNAITGNMPNALLNQQTPQAHYNTPGVVSSVYNTPHFGPGQAYNPTNANTNSLMSYPFNYYPQIMIPPSVMNMGLQTQQPLQQPLLSQPETNPNLYDILNLPTSTPSLNQALEKALDKMPASQPPQAGVAGMWNRLYNNAPVEKGPPVNVVITNSDPLPAHTTVSTQSTLSVTIPPHHIKPSLVPNELGGVSQPQANTSFPIITSGLSFAGGATGTVTTPASSVPTVSFSTAISFVPPPKQVTSNKANDSTGSDIHNKSTEIEYEPNVTFKPVIPLPDEVEVTTGEENEEVLFCSRAKLLRLIEKEWKERGVGDIKILKSKTDGKIRILMRREQIHKMCANHYITPELKLTQAKGDEKSFIWCVDDFADEQMKREKLCVRFKQVETAKEFQKAFQSAQQELKSQGKKAAATNPPPPGEKPKTAPEKEKPATAAPAIGGFSLSKSAPFSFAKTNTSTPKPEGKTPSTSKSTATAPATTPNAFGKLNFGLEKKDTPVSKDPKPAEANKPSPFANFSFASINTTPPKADSPFANIFSKAVQPTSTTDSVSSAAATTQTLNKSNASDTDAVEEYEPNVDFKPVIPLPDLVDVQTGEENEDIFFEHRAKLLRFDKSTSEWKERGVGIMKILVDRNDANKVRLVMRRDQIFKLCCNQRLLKDTVFKNAQNSTKALTWVGQDYSENELQSEVLAIRFKTDDICADFRNAVLKAQSNMTDGGEQKGASSAISMADTSTATTGFGDKFKPKPGSWSCQACYTSNTADTLHCMACEQPKDETVPKKSVAGVNNAPASTPFKFGFGANVNAQTTKTQLAVTTTTKSTAEGFGDKFKPKVGSWACQACYLSNGPDVLYCTACESPKDNTVPKKQPAATINAPTKPAFTFGFGANANAQTTKAQPADADSTTKGTTEGFGDKFKPKVGSWSCQGCYVSNGPDILYCTACETPKDDTVPKKAPATTNAFAPSANAPKFQFGFGSPAATTTNAAVDLSKKESAKPTAPVTANPSPFDRAATGFNFGMSSVTASTNAFTTSTEPNKPFSFTSPNMFGAGDNSQGQQTTTNGSDFRLEKPQFSFTLKTKSPGKAKSPTKSFANEAAEEDSDEENIEEESTAYFAPVIPLPDKVDVVTGEENEDELYCHRGKLFRFMAGEWKERGIGDIKILRHKETKKTRVVMRREKIHKICLNHILTPDIEYKPKDEKSWQFSANDFSEGELQYIVFSVRFKAKEIADEFIAAVRDVQKEIAESAETAGEPQDITSGQSNLPEETIKLADRLKLPYSFYQIDESAKCPGCRGCDPDNFVFPEYASKNEFVEDASPIPLSMPQVKSTANRSILKQSVLTTPSLAAKSEVTKNLFGGSAGLFSKTANDKPKDAETKSVADSFSFRLDDSQSKPAIQEATTDNKFQPGGFLFGNSTTFASADKTKPVFGQALFGNSNFGSTIANGTTATTGIFGGANMATTASITTTTSDAVPATTTPSKPVPNLFSSLNIAAKENTSPAQQQQPAFANTTSFTFGGTADFGSSFGSTTSAATTTGNIFGGNIIVPTNNNKESETKDPIQTNEPVFKSDPGLSFASLAANATSQPTNFPAKTAESAQASGGFFGLKQTGDFSIFLTGKDGENKHANVSATSQDGAGDEAYDPHYDPVIALPELIHVSTGEEEEEKLFGERGVLFRYDTTNKEWKERGTGEVKVLYHPEKKTYRLILRREQIHKLVLNHAIAVDFQLKLMNTSGKAYCWGGMNYAENPPELERLAVRFKKTEIAKSFEMVVLNCVENLKQRGADLEPEED